MSVLGTCRFVSAGNGNTGNTHFVEGKVIGKYMCSFGRCMNIPFMHT